MSFSTLQISYSASSQDDFTLSSIFKSLFLPLTLSHLPITLGSHGLCFCFLKAASLDAALEPLHWLVLLFGAPSHLSPPQKDLSSPFLQRLPTQSLMYYPV